MSCKYSVIIPLKNEEENIADLINEVEPIMNSFNAAWEMICIDDGSTDNTLKILKSMTEKKRFLKAIVFDKNYGQSSAFDAGFKMARGEFIISMDGDRQNDPADIPKLVEQAENYDLVCGIRQKRKDTMVKNFTSKVANSIRSSVCKDGVSDTGCSLKIYRSKSLQNIKMFDGMHRFLPALFLLEGYKICQIPVNHRRREKGKTKYSFLNRSFNTIHDLLAVRWMIKRRLKYKIIP